MPFRYVNAGKTAKRPHRHGSNSNVQLPPKRRLKNPTTLSSFGQPQFSGWHHPVGLRGTLYLEVHSHKLPGPGIA
eukprot:1140344-Pelagomonas_calceolata.AAC.13